MIKLYLRLAGRQLLRRKTFSLINILGLSTGIAACLLIYGYVHFQGSFDSYHSKADRIVRVTSAFRTPESEILMATTNIPLAGAVVRDLPQVERGVRIQPAKMPVKKGASIFEEEHFVYSEPSIFSVFSISFLEGSAAGALSEPNGLVLTQSTARRYFGKEEAVGKDLTCDKHPYRVSAVIADLPANSDLKIDAILSKDFSHTVKWMDDDFEVYTFILYRNKPDIPSLKKQLAVYAQQYIQPELDKAGAPTCHVTFDAEMLKDVHFSKGKLIDTPKGSRLFNTIFSVLAIFILLVAILNYINLSTARAEERAKEVAVRKVAGANPPQLMRQFLGESFLLLALSWLIGLGLAEATIPFFNKALATHISLGGGSTVTMLLIVFPLTGLLAGAWPAFVLSGFQPIRVLKGLKVENRGIGLRKVLMVVQFVIALVMLTGTVVIYTQMHYMLHKDLGVDRSEMIALTTPDDPGVHRGMFAFAEEIKKLSGVKGMTIGSGLPIEGVAMNAMTIEVNGHKKEIMSNMFYVDPQFIPLMHIQLVEGRNLTDSITLDKHAAFIVNEAYVRVAGWQHGLGQTFPGTQPPARIVGVVKDFFYKSLHNSIGPMMMAYKDSGANTVLIKASPAVLPRVREVWSRYFPADPFSYYFLDESFESQYKDDELTMSLFNVFTVLAIFISCLGLYGLISLVTLRRTREIGIRKVLGASGVSLSVLLTREFFVLIGCAALIGMPLAGWGLHKWLESYAYHTTLAAWMFGVPLLMLVGITLSVTGLRILRTIHANPVESLRTE